MEHKTNLKSCPFCGGNACIIADIHSKRYVISCSKCGASTGPQLYGTHKLPVGGKRHDDSDRARAEVIALWNNRINNKML